MKTNCRYVAMSFCFLANLAVCETSFAFPEPVREWTVELGNELAGSPTPYPSAAPDSVVVATGGHLVRVDGAGNVIARVEFGPEEGRWGEIMPPPAELDGDPDEELVLTNKTGIIFGFDMATGTILWETDLGQPIDQYAFVTAGDIDEDGLDEVVVTTIRGWATCLDEDGSIVWQTRVYTVDKSITPEISKSAIGDINNDGFAEIVYGTATHHLIALDRFGRLVWDSVAPPHQMSRTPVLIADIDQNGTAEVYSMSSMLSPGKGLVCVDGESGKLRWTGLTVGKAYLGLKPVRFSDGSQGVLSCDKGGNIHAYRSDGSLAWHTRLNGRGVYWPPSVADLDGDGRLEIVATIRWTSQDGKGFSWYVVDADSGDILGEYSNGDGYPAPAVCDIDRDGVLEVLINSTGGRLTAFSFYGAATKDAVYIGSWYEPRYPAQIEPAVPKKPFDTPELDLLPEKDFHLRFGNNTIEVQLPQPAGPRQSVQLECIQPDGVRRVEVRSPEPGAVAVSLNLPVTRTGTYALTSSLLDLETGETLGEDKRTVQVRDVLREIDQARQDTVDALDDARSRLVSQGLEAASLMAQLAGRADTEFELLAARIAAVSELSPAEREVLLSDSDAYMVRLERSRNMMALALAEVEAGRKPSFVMWQDVEPWDNVDPLDELPSVGTPPSAELWAFGDEFESACFNIVNISAGPLRLRVEPGALKAVEEREGLKLPRVVDTVRLHTAVSLPSNGESVPDLLPRLGEGQMIDVAPGQFQRLWLNVSTHELEAGAYEITWEVRTLDVAADSATLSLSLDVSPARCPENSRFLAGYWRPPLMSGHNLIPDMNEHLVTMWFGLPLPSAEANAEGEIVGEMDWTEHDAILRQIKQPELLFYAQQQVPTPEFPESVEVSDALRLAGQRSYAKHLVAHLAEMGLGYEDFMFYAEDEPGLKGEITSFMENARRNKLIDPNIQNYANPWGAFTREMLEEMATVTDVWQPGMEVLEFWGDEARDIMRRGDKRISMYTPVGGVRSVRPLGFYRSQAWLALHWGIEGGGWFAYQINDLFVSADGAWPGYGGVHVDPRDVITSRRWEAQRDGIEDFNIVSDLRDLAVQKGDDAALAAIDEAIAYVAGAVLTGATREAAEYDFSYVEFMRHRSKIRQEYERLLKQ